ncbi:MAG TPA: ATP-binding cassette domain-containing protein, partial [Gemmatimonadaceae bacterium]|nr:ATP-binding cassette domain-containing protein [Gemmatimonadaceae bacterium]
MTARDAGSGMRDAGTARGEEALASEAAPHPASRIPHPAPPAVLMHHIEKRFGATRADRDASLEVAAGEVHALVGENGAGKSTLMHILAGLFPPDAGQV